MSYNKDFILRLLEQIRNMLVRLVGLIEQGKMELVQAEMDAISQKITGKKIAEILPLDVEDIALLLSEGGNNERLKQLEYLSDILFLYAAKITDDLNEYNKALDLSGSLLKYIINTKSTVLDLSLNYKMNKVISYQKQSK